MTGKKQSPYVSGLIRYVFVGGIATGTDLLVFAILTLAWDWQYLVAGAISFLFGTASSYIFGLLFVFRGGRHARPIEVALVFLSSGIGLALHTAALYSMVEWLYIPVFLAKVLAALVTIVWNFSSRFFWIFSR